MNIRVHIDRLILDGVALKRGEGNAVKHAMERELGRLLLENGLHSEFQRGGAVPLVSTNGFHPPTNASSKELGMHIAQSVYGGIGKAK